jgi:hypothetical protein
MGYKKMKFILSVFFSMGIILVGMSLSGCNIIKDSYYYDNAETKINTIFDNYASSSTIPEEEYAESEYGDYSKLIELQVEYIKETEKLYTELNNALDELDSTDINAEFEDLKSDLDKKLEVAVPALEKYSDTETVEKNHISKMKALDLNSSNIDTYINDFEDGNNNFSKYDSGYSDIIKKAVEDYQEISTVIGSHLEGEIDEATATNQINDLLTDINAVYSEADTFSTDFK